MSAAVDGEGKHRLAAMCFWKHNGHAVAARAEAGGDKPPPRGKGADAAEMSRLYEAGSPQNESGV